MQLPTSAPFAVSVGSLSHLTPRTVLWMRLPVKCYLQSIHTNARVPADVVVANCCIESWLLGNRKFIKRNPAGDALQSFRREYDVTQLDPEIMPNGRPARYNTRAQYHKAYLRAAYMEHNLKLTESKPGPALEPYYLQALLDRASAEDVPKQMRTFAAMVATFSQK